MNYFSYKEDSIMEERYDIFISYRRDGGVPVAEAIYQNLHSDYACFLDRESLKNGYFDDEIKSRIKNCTDFIVIISETVFDRCNEPNDWISCEVEIALKEHKNIIPIFVGTQKFPDNIPEQLKEIQRYNGIFWDDEAETLKKLKSFLLSNQQYQLFLVAENNRLVLTHETKESLKYLYRKFIENGRHPINIKIRIPDTDELSTLAIDDVTVNKYGVETAEYFAEQKILKRIKRFRIALEFAIEYLLQDEIIDDCADKLSDLYFERYGKDNCFFTSKEKIQYPYWTVFAWFDMIEELLKEIPSSRYHYYANHHKEFTAIDCFINQKNGKTIWHFVSFIRRQANDEDYDRLKEILSMPGGYACLQEVPPRERIFHVFPDFYFNIGMVKANLTNYSFNAFSEHDEMFNILNYSIGLH